MRLTVLALIALLLCTGPVAAAPAGPAGADFREYAGTIGDLRIVMTLDKNGAKLTGEYRYASQRTTLSLRGVMIGDRDFVLEEFDEDKNTGQFNGTFNDDGSVAGQWASPDGAAVYPFRLEEKAPAPWTGRWSRTKYYFSPASLTIWNVDADGFDFRLSASSGGHSGVVDTARAQFAGETAIFQSQWGGTLTFRLQGDGLVIEQQGNMGAGMGVVYSGEYRRGKVDLAPPTLTEHGVFKNPTAEETFKALVGDSYGTFLRTFHLVSKEEDLDKIGATVYRGGVRGLFTINEGIVMHTPDGEMWAALVVLDKVSYYTNSARFAGLPLTLEHWRSRFPNKPVFVKARP